MAANDTESKQNEFDYLIIGKEYGVSLQFHLSASDFMHQPVENDIITEKHSNTKWRFHYHQGNTSQPILYDGIHCWDMDNTFLNSMTATQSVTLADDYTYALLVNWRKAEIHSDNEKSAAIPNLINPQNHSIQQPHAQSQHPKHRKAHHWRIPLRARINNQFVDWITLRSSNASRTSSIGLRTNAYNEKYHSAPSQNKTRNRTDAVSLSQTEVINSKKATFIGCDYKMENDKIFGVWSLILITGKRHSFDSPDCVFYLGTKHKSIRKMGAIRASVARSCLCSIGSDGNAKDAKYCSGKIAKVMIWNGILSKTDIQKLYEQIFQIYDPQILRSLVGKSQKWHSLPTKYTKKKKKRRNRAKKFRIL